MARKGLNKLSGRLETLREASRRVCKHVLQKTSDVVAVYVVGSVARGNIHEQSDVDMAVLVEHGDKPKRENLKELGCSVDIVYAPYHLLREKLHRGVGSEWEIDASNIVDSLVLYDPNGVIQKIKSELKVYPEEKRRMNILQIYDKMGWFSEAVWYHYLRKTYDVESFFSKFFAIQALKILFPLNRVYLKGDKYIFEQVEELQEKPRNFLEKSLSLCWFKSQNVNYDEATWIINTVSEINKAIEAKIRRLLPDSPRKDMFRPSKRLVYDL